MCVIKINRDFDAEVVYDVGGERSEPDTRIESFDAGQELDIDIYEAGGGLASIQFPKGPIIVGLPADWFRVVSPCQGGCEDPHGPDASPLGLAPRRTAEEWRAQVEKSRRDLEKLTERLDEWSSGTEDPEKDG